MPKALWPSPGTLREERASDEAALAPSSSSREKGRRVPMNPARAALEKAHRIVVKVGSRSLAGDRDLVSELSRQIADLSNARRAFVVVTSGAIALGGSRLGYRRRPKEMPKLQAAAA